MGEDAWGMHEFINKMKSDGPAIVTAQNLKHLDGRLALLEKSERLSLIVSLTIMKEVRERTSPSHSQNVAEITKKLS